MIPTRRLSSLLLVVALLLALAPAQPAAAASRYLCTGYVGCQQDGYPHFGYRKAGKKMWWRMYAGHNCTNYVAYRLVRGGMSAERPWSGTGMAWNWGRAKRGITDRRPMVGSVAWWNSNAPGAGSSGHVAYVEKVISDTKIIVSEDSWGGDFHWRRIRKADGRWPTGFIHFDDRRVELRSAPAVSGEPAVGSTLTVTSGAWTPSARYAYQWLADGRAVPGATARTFTPTPAHRGRRLTVRVEATSRGHLPGKAWTQPTARVVRGTLTSTATPAVTGTPRVDEVLRLVPATWSPAPDSTSVQWLADGSPIPGATANRLRLRQDHVGKRVSVRMAAVAEGYRRSVVVSAPTPPVDAGRIALASPYVVSGTLRMGRRLTLTPGTHEPAAARVAYSWLRDGVPVPGATGRGYALGVDDVGARITARVLLRHPGYRDKTLLLAPEGRVNTAPVLRVTPVARVRRAVVRLRVTAPGVDVPGGRATVRVGRREVTGRLVDGRLRVVVEDLAPGTRRVRVLYTGTPVVRAARATGTVEVLARRRS